MTSRINRQQATWPQPSKTGAVINTTSLYRKRVRHSPKTCRERKRGGERGESLFTALSSVKTWGLLLPAWVLIQSGACSYKPWGLRHPWTDWVAFTRELAQGRFGSRSVGPLRLTCVGPGCLWRWWWWGQVSWLRNMGQSQPRICRPRFCKSWILLMLFLLSV